jgi:DNA-binding NarL/FixJ family response regulator
MLRTPCVVPVLTQRQMEVSELRLQGKGRRQIAEALGLSSRTVREDLDRARSAIGAADELELLLYVDRLSRQPA